MIFTREEKQNWSLWNKIGFRFAFIYFSFYCFSIIGGGLFKPLIYWVADTFLNISYDFGEKGYGSGDTTYQYILLLIIAALSVFGTFIWSIFDRRKSYNQLNYALILVLRFVLIAFMFIYGFIKIFHMQMIPPTYSRLLSSLGDMSPMGLAWTFMGYSKLYVVFAGTAEVIAGILLVSRRLQTIGSLMIIAVMGNVFIMNMAFDIPVKIFSFHLMLMGVFLFLTNGKRFLNSVILRKAVAQEKSYPIIDKNSLKVFRIIKASVTALAIFLSISAGISRTESFNERLNPIMKGAWEVTYFEKNGEKQLPLITDKNYWRYFILEVKGGATVLKLDSSKEQFSIEIDTVTHQMNLVRRLDDTKIKLDYTRDEDSLELNGIIDSDSLLIKMTRKTEKDFNLTNREFRWINEKPNNQ